MNREDADLERRLPHGRKLRVGIVFGGRSGEHEVSLMSARSVVAALDPDKYEVVGIGITREGRWLLSGAPLAKLLHDAGDRLEPGPRTRAIALTPDPASAALVPLDGATGVSREVGPAHRPDVIFPLVHGTHGEDGSLQGLLELAELPYVGPGVLASAVGMDKAVFKAVMQAHGIPVAPFRLLIVPRSLRDERRGELRAEPTAGDSGAERDSGLEGDSGLERAPGAGRDSGAERESGAGREPEAGRESRNGAAADAGEGRASLHELDWLRAAREIGYPLFVKPANGGSSLGVSKVKREQELVAAIYAAAEYDRRVLVERAIVGRELECAVLGNDAPQASVAGEVIPGHEFYDYDDKYFDDQARLEIPARLSPKQMDAVRDLSVRAFRAIDAAGMARVDFFLEDGTGDLYVNEVNTIPGFTRISMYPKLWEASGVPFPRLLDRLILLALERADDMLQRKLSP